MAQPSQYGSSERRRQCAPGGGILMSDFATLQERLEETARSSPALRAACEVVSALADAGAEIAASLALPTSACESVSDDRAKRPALRRAQEIFVNALRRAPVASIASDSLEGWVVLDPDQPLAVAFDPLDRLADFEAISPGGAIFSILPANGPNSPFLGRNVVQTAAGFFTYGAQTSLVLTLGEGVDIYVFDRRDDSWRLTQTKVIIPAGAPEYAIDPARYLHWEEPVRFYFENCLDEF